jgi:hypothetical protein
MYSYLSLTLNLGILSEQQIMATYLPNMLDYIAHMRYTMIML